MRRFLRDESGQSVHEYGMLIAFVAIVLVIAIRFFSGSITAWFAAKADAITSF